MLHIHRAMHAVIDRNPRHGINFRVLTKLLRLIGGDHLHSGTVVGKLEGDREATLGWIGMMRERYTKEDRAKRHLLRPGLGLRCPACSRWPPAASTSGTCRRWFRSSATTRCCSSAAARSAIPGATPPARRPTAWRSKPASRPATRAGSSRREGRDILTKAAQSSPELKIAMETWKEIKFEFDTVDKLDVAHR